MFLKGQINGNIALASRHIFCLNLSLTDKVFTKLCGEIGAQGYLSDVSHEGIM